jgi:hypothetical protein
MRIYRNALIFSVARKELTPEVNRQRHFDVMDFLDSREIPYYMVQGCYQGVQEQSLMIDGSHRDYVVDICERYDQECFLEQDANGQVSLVYPNGREDIGRWCIDENAEDNYTIVNGVKYTTKK